jgi:hypothetical protein
MVRNPRLSPAIHSDRRYYEALNSIYPSTRARGSAHDCGKKNVAVISPRNTNENAIGGNGYV